MATTPLGRANSRQRHWARKMIEESVNPKLAEIREACTTQSTRITFDEMVKRFKAGTLKLRPKDPSECRCLSIDSSVRAVFDVGDRETLDSERYQKAEGAFRAFVREQIKIVSITAETSEQVARAVDAVRDYKMAAKPK